MGAARADTVPPLALDVPTAPLDAVMAELRELRAEMARRDAAHAAEIARVRAEAAAERERDRAAHAADQARWMGMMEAVIAGRGAASTPANDPILNDLWADYRDNRLSRKRPRTRMAFESRIKHVLARFGDRRVSTLRFADLDAYRDRIGVTTYRKTPLSELSWNHEVTCATVMLNWAAKHGRIPVNPWRGYELASVESKPRMIYTHEQIGRLMDNANEWLRAVILVMTSAGLRPTEVLQLERSQVDPRTRLVKLRGAQTKNRKGRTVRVSAAAMMALRTLPIAGDWWLTNPETGRAFSQTTLNAWWRKTRDAAGVWTTDEAAADLYACRSTFATWLGDRNVAPHIIKALLGHTSWAHLDKYLKAGEQQILSITDALDEADRRSPQRASTPRSSDVVHRKVDGT